MLFISCLVLFSLVSRSEVDDWKRKYNMMKAIVLVLLLCAEALSEMARYDNYTVYRVTLRNGTGSLDSVRNLVLSNPNLEIFSDKLSSEPSLDVLAPPELSYLFGLLSLDSLLNVGTIVPNLQNLIENSNCPTADVNSRPYGWDCYYKGDKMNAWLQSLEQQYPNNVKVIKGGKSYEGRDIVGVKVTYGPQNLKKAVFLEGGIHAREWIAHATVTYILNEILTSKDPAVRSMAESRDWYIFPNINPDGYAYTFTGNRLWRKNRKPFLLGACHGVDLNRNWNYHWMEGGASTNPCSDTYAGTAAFSEIETSSLSQYIATIAPYLHSYLSFHSYSQLLLIPYGYTAEPVDNYNELYDIGLQAVQSLAERYGTNYTVGNIVNVLYVASGCSVDWVKGIHKTRLTYSYEVRDTGNYGFLLPPDQIIPNGQEVLDSLVTIMSFDN